VPVRQDPPGSRCEVERLIREAITVHVESLRAHGESVEPPSAVAATS
jgi:predicted RNase H-like HicB family nuclease